jgi:hypothetical protein
MSLRLRDRFHVRIGKRRTTVTLHYRLSGLLAVKLGADPETEEAHGVVRQWLQEQLDESDFPQRDRLSQWLQGEAMLFVADTKVSKRYWSELDD